MFKLAYLSKTLSNNKVQCRVCEHYCTLAPGEWGKCGVRVNREGTLYLSVYGDAVALHIDPIEKKPLYHFLPGSEALSVGTYGCNLRCQWCQNWQLSQVTQVPPQKSDTVSPQTLVDSATQQGCASIAYTYNEPTVFLEYSLDTAKLAQQAGIKNVYVSNGFMSQESLDMLVPYLDAINIDLKGFTEDLYRHYTASRLDPVKRNIAYLATQTEVWVEVTTLVIPDLNDSDAELTQAAEWLASVDPAMPWHISAFHPSYHMQDRPRTPEATLERAYEIGKRAGLKHVYVGNVYNPEREASYCANCNARLIERSGYRTRTRWSTPGVCPTCGERLAGVFT